MGKQLYFWLGLFVAIIIGLPISIIYTEAIPEHASLIVALAIGFTFGITALLIIVLFFKETLLRLVTRGPKQRIEEIGEKSFNTLEAYNRGDLQSARNSFAELTGPILNWFLWTQFYRWVIATMLGLLVITGTFAGTVLLADQNKKFDVQNAISGIELTEYIRDRFINSRRAERTQSGQGLVAQLPNCSVHFQALPDHLNSIASTYIIKDIAKRGRNQHLRPKVLSSLDSLLEDHDGGVVLSALAVLSELDAEVEKTNVYINNAYSDYPVHLNTAAKLEFRGSYISWLICDTCGALTFERSAASMISGRKVYLTESVGFAVGGTGTTGVLSSLLYAGGDDLPLFETLSMSGGSMIVTAKGPGNIPSRNATLRPLTPIPEAITTNKLSDPCAESMRHWNLCEKNPFLKCEPRLSQDSLSDFP